MIRVAVLRGGPSPAYDDSLKTGAHILSLLQEARESYHPIDIFISKDGEWHRGGVVRDPHSALHGVDMVWNAMHGAYGEDGQVQRILEKFQIPFTGSSAVASALAMNKEMTKSIYDSHSLPTPRHVLISEEDLSDELLLEIFRNYMHPVVVKPSRGSGSLAVTVVHTFPGLRSAVERALAHSPRVLVEEGVRGEEATCGIVEKARGEELYALVPLGRFSVDQNKKIEDMARQAHETLGLKHYSSSDFIVTKSGKIYILETNSQPVFHADSHFHKSLIEVGWPPKDFVDHCIQLALRR